MIWDQAAINDLKTLWADPLLSMTEIGRRLGCSKNAIAGKRFHLDLEPRQSPILKGGKRPVIAAKPAPAGTLPLLPSLVPLPLPSLFGTVAVVRAHHSITTTQEQERRILLMTKLSDRKCGEVNGVSRDVVRRVRAAAPPVAAVGQTVRPVIPAPPPPRAFPAPPARPMTLACCWPIGEPGTKTFRFCDGVDVVPGKPYCQEHHALAYVRVLERDAWQTP